MFEGRTDITRDELEAALTQIYMQQAFDASYKTSQVINNSDTDYIGTTTYDKETTTELTKIIGNIANEVSETMTDTVCIIPSPIILIYQNILGCLNEAIDATMHGDYARVEEAINTLMELLEHLSSEYGNNTETTDHINTIKKSVARLNSQVAEVKAGNIVDWNDDWQ